MTFPPFKSMYLVRGVLTALALMGGVTYFLVHAMFLPAGRETPLYVDFMAMSLFMAFCASLIMGLGYAILKRDEVRRQSLITDDSLPDYERETLRAIRAASPWARQLPTKTLLGAYQDWSVAELGRSVRESAPADIRAAHFLSWAFTRPIDRY